MARMCHDMCCDEGFFECLRRANPSDNVGLARCEFEYCDLVCLARCEDSVRRRGGG